MTINPFYFLLMLACFFTSTTSVASQIIDKSLFGMHVIRFHNPALLPSVEYGSVRLWDTGTTWAHLQPTPNQWNWSRLDLAINNTFSDKEIILTLGMTPAWASSSPTSDSYYGAGQAVMPASLADWENYIRTIIDRYGNRISALEVWNEADVSGFFKGSIADLVTLTQSAREVIDRSGYNIKLISPSFASGSSLDRFLELGGGKYVDIIGLHLYNPYTYPEYTLVRLDTFKLVMKEYGIDKPIWNVESGFDLFSNFGTACTSSSMSVPAYLARSYLQLASNDVQRFYWYAWDHSNYGFVDDNGALKGSVITTVFDLLHQWLNGKSISKCQKSSTGLWSCTVTDVDGNQKRIIWSNVKSQYFYSEQPMTATRIDGLITKFKSRLVVGTCPVLIE